MVGMRYKNEYAVSAIVSTIMSIVIVMSVISVSLFWGRPFVERIQMQASMNALYDQFRTATDSTAEMIQEGSVSARRFEVLLQGGDLIMNSTGDRFVLSYSLGNPTDFSVEGLDDDDAIFIVTGISANMKAVVYRFPLYYTPLDIVEPVAGGLVNSTTLRFNWSLLTPPPYTYWLENYSEQWSSYTSAKTKTLSNIPDGTYTFNVQNAIASLAPISFRVVEGTYLTTLAEEISAGGGDTFICNSDLTGTIRIDLFDEDTDLLLGRFFVFDLGSISCVFPSSFGTYQKIIENNGVLNSEPGLDEVEIDPSFSSSLNSLSMRVVQLRSVGPSTVGRYGKFTYGVSLLENYVRERFTTVFHLKIQVYGQHKDVWLQYFEKKYDFIPVDDNTVAHPGLDGATRLLLSQSVCITSIE